MCPISWGQYRASSSSSIFLSCHYRLPLFNYLLFRAKSLIEGIGLIKPIKLTNIFTFLILVLIQACGVSLAYHFKDCKAVLSDNHNCRTMRFTIHPCQGCSAVLQFSKLVSSQGLGNVLIASAKNCWNVFFRLG
jgi:hypothetical protein